MINSLRNILLKHGYSIGQFVGRGTSSECYTVNNPQFGQKQFVCKIINLLNDSQHKQNIEIAKKEIQILSHLDHPNIIRCYDYFQENNAICAILEYCQHGNMADLILSHTPLDISKIEDFSIQLVDAVSFLHLHEIAHLDITPTNILFTEYDKIKLSSFHNSVQVPNGTKITLNVGTNLFRAPEIGNGPYDPYLADIFSLGVTLLVMAKRDVAMGMSIVQDYIPYLIKETQSLGEFGLIIKDCLNVNPIERPNVFQVLEKLKNIIQHHGTTPSKSCGSLKHMLGFSNQVSSKLLLVNKNKLTKKSIHLGSKLTAYKSAPMLPTQRK